MIEVNLLPGGKKRSGKSRGFSLSSLSLPRLGGGGERSTDSYLIGAVGAGILSIAIMAWLFFGVRSDREEAQVSLEAQVQDSIRFADLLKRTNELTARRDSIAQRVGIIQEIDADRFVWAHVLDEVSRALPDYTWLLQITQTSSDPLQIRIRGRAGNMYAITTFMTNLEASPFLRNVTVESIEQMQGEEDQRDVVQEFSLLMSYESPPLDQLETVPLFENEPGGPAAADTTRS
ncbi:MAG: PilN domain-containing protein [Gemmatimonadetes bacterium]|nr:PilN domain-containing protein [Gemmatimonadota bacterium]